MRTTIKLFYALLFTLLVCPLFSQWSKFNHQYNLNKVSSGWHKIVLPETMFEKLNRDLSDIRIYGIVNNDTLESPYIIKSSIETPHKVDIPFQLINQTKNVEGYCFTFQIKGDFNINEIQLEFAQKNFDWKVKLEGGNNQKEWFTILDQYRIVAIQNKSIAYTFSTLQFSDVKYNFFRLLVPSKEKPNLTLAKVSQVVSDKGTYKLYPSKMNISKVGKTSQYEVELKNKVPLSRLELAIDRKYDYYRTFSLEYLVDSTKTEKGWIKNYRELTHGILSSFGSNVFLFEELITNRFRLHIDNQDNSALVLNNIQIGGAEKILCMRIEKEGNYFLVFGNNASMPPNYDLENFKDKIPVEAPNIELGQEQTIAHSPMAEVAPLFKNKLWLWVIMGLIIAILGGFTFKMLRKG